MIVSQLDFSYRLVGSGWAEAKLELYSQRVLMQVSCITDALGDLVRAVADLGEGAARARVTWAEEPGWYRWRLDRHGSDVEVQLWWYAGGYDAPFDPAK